MNLDEQEALAFLGSLFPGGLKDPSVIAEFCPDGWGCSPLFACYHPSPEVRYAESLEFSRNLKNLGLLRNRRKGEVAQAPPEEPEPTFEDEMWSGWDGGDYMRFYMGTCWLGRRADLGPVYRLIFRRLKSLGADWSYSFPRLHLIDFGAHEEDPGNAYDPSTALQQEAERKARAEKLRKLRRKMDRDTLAAKREARRNEPPATVLAYQEVYRSFPTGWPPDPYPEESQI